MADKMRCPGCGQEYPLSEKLSGKKVRCKKCQQVFQVPVLLTAVPAAPVAPELTPLGSGMGNLLDDELMAGDAMTGNDPFAAGTTLPSASKLKPLPKRKKKKQLGNLGQGFLGTHKLMLAVVVLTVFVLLVSMFSKIFLIGMITAGTGLVIAVFGLLPYPAPNTSKAGMWYALVNCAIVVYQLVLLGLALSKYSAEILNEIMGEVVAKVGGYFLLEVAVIVVISLLMRRFGFFRPSAWMFLMSGCVIAAVAITNLSDQSSGYSEMDIRKATQQNRTTNTHRTPKKRVPTTQKRPKSRPTSFPSGSNKPVEVSPRVEPDSRTPRRDSPSMSEEQRKMIEEHREKMEEMRNRRRRPTGMSGFGRPASRPRPGHNVGPSGKPKPPNPFEPDDTPKPKSSNPFDPDGTSKPNRSSQTGWPT